METTDLRAPKIDKTHVHFGTEIGVRPDEIREIAQQKGSIAMNRWTAKVALDEDTFATYEFAERVIAETKVIEKILKIAIRLLNKMGHKPLASLNGFGMESDRLPEGTSASELTQMLDDGALSDRFMLNTNARAAAAFIEHCHKEIKGAIDRERLDSSGAQVHQAILSNMIADTSTNVHVENILRRRTGSRSSRNG